MLKEQVVAPRAGRAKESKGRAAASGGPSRRPKGGAFPWRAALRYAPLALKLLLAIFVGVVLFYGYRAASSATFFRLSSLDVEGASRTSQEEVRDVVRRHVSGVGVWRADLAALGEHLERQPWVRSAVVSRVLPSGLRVRLTEREPRAVARTSGGRFVWVDDEGVTLGPAQPSDRLPPFFLRGLDEAPTDAARAANRERVEKALAMVGEWESAGLTPRVSEVNLDDLRDVRVQLAGDDAQIEVRLGGRDFGARLGEAVKTLEKVRQQRPDLVVTRLDATQAVKGGRVIVGYRSGPQTVEGGAASNAAQPAVEPPKGNTDAPVAGGGVETVRREVAARRPSAPPAAPRTPDKREVSNQKREEKPARQNAGAKPERAGERPGAQQQRPAAAAGAERPRRVG